MSSPSNCELPLEINLQSINQEHSNIVQEPQNLRMSFHSLDLRESINKQRTKNRISMFCEQERIMADKDLRIQELLMEERSFKHETGFIIHSLQNEAYQNNHQRMALLQQIEKLKLENASFFAQLQNKDKIIQCLNLRLQNTDYSYQKFENQIRVLRQQIAELKEHHAQIKYLKAKENKQQNIDCLNPQSAVSQKQKLNQQSKNTTSIIQKIQYELKIQTNNKSIQKKLSQILKKIESLNISMRDKNVMHNLQIKGLKKMLKESDWSSSQNLAKNIYLNQEVGRLKQKILFSQQTIQELKLKLDEIRKEKQAKDVELFNIRLKNEESKNFLSFELRKVPELPQEDEDISDESLRESSFTQDNYHNNKSLQTFRLKQKIMDLQKKQTEQNQLVKNLNEQLSSEKKKLANFLKAAWEFGQDFGNFVNQFGAYSTMLKNKKLLQSQMQCSTGEKMQEVFQSREEIVVRQYS